MDNLTEQSGFKSVLIRKTTQTPNNCWNSHEMSITHFPEGCPKNGEEINYTVFMQGEKSWIDFPSETEEKKFESLPKEMKDALTPPSKEDPPYTGPDLVGKVYRGVVKNRLSGINAAFVQIKELSTEDYSYIHRDDLNPKRIKKGSTTIKDLIKEEEEITVQIMKNPKSDMAPKRTRVSEVF